MTIDASGEWPHPPTGPWLTGLALSCAIHVALVWQGWALVWPAHSWVRDVMPVVLLSASPEAPRPEPPPPRPAARPASTPRLVTPAVPGPTLAPPTPPVSPSPEPVAARPAPPTQTEAASSTSVVSMDAAAKPSASEGARNDAPGPHAARTEPMPAGSSIAAIAPTAPPLPRISQPARPRGGYQVRPSYPATARRAGAEGTTVLRVHVRADGTIDDVQISRSAGHAALDEAAAAAVARWRFEPARSGSEAVAVWVLVPVEFRLQNEN